MTSRSSLASSQRQPQRTLSASGLSQRPATQRSLSQQYLPQSPKRRSDGFNNEQGADGGDGAQNRYGTTPRRGGSKLKLELANDGIVHTGFVESPQNPDPLSANKVFTPSRVMSMADAPDLGDMSPQTSRCQTADGDSAPLPMPPRRTRFVAPSKRFQPSPVNAPAKKDARTKPFVLDVPPDAPRYSTMGRQEPCGRTRKNEGSTHRDTDAFSGYADFYPWRGGHPEDQFSDNIIRMGYFDKPPAPQTQELTSAKPTLFPALKHKTGLQTLSNIFTGILNQRRHIGQITSPSTFKPPPRVTLTDTKREAWLKDLANSTIPLRRLSRTIPHGIRGRVLLDQCLNKNVPTDRAVWLAKCVGANEIRAFKRKGVNNTFVMGGEVKWIRDWTLCVEQFVEAIISAFTEEDWKAKVTYAIRLAAHLYAEHLLDRDHYMEWLIINLESSSEAKLPMWLLLIQIYWKDMLKLRRHGRRLVTAMLNHHCSIYDSPDRDILLPLSIQLGSLIESLISASPDSFVHPDTWSKRRDSLKSFLSSRRESAYTAFDTIDARTDLLTSSNVRTRPAIRSTLVALLDNMLRLPFKDDIPGQIRKATKNTPVLIRTTLEWCTSLYRFGAAKVYVAVTILRSLSDSNTDLTNEILCFLNADALQEPPRKHSIYHLISELVRSGHFSVPQYIQWLIATGGLHEPFEAQPDGPCSRRLLVEIPAHAFNDSMRSVRASLLRRASFSVEDEASDIAMAIRCVKHALSVPLDDNDLMLQKQPMSVRKLARRIGLSSRSLKAEVSSWLANDFAGSVFQQPQADKAHPMPLERSLDTIRTLLEAAQDFNMLDTTLAYMTNSSNVEALSYCVNTLSLHLPVFFAMGSAKPLFNSFYDRLRSISLEQGVGARPLLASLANLAPRLPGFESMASQLRNELLIADRSNAVDASSPLSDNMATQLQDDETELGEQIEKLANYTSADKLTMERLFHTIVTKLVSCWAKGDERQRPYSILLSRLRVFDTQYFDTLMKDWVQHIRKLTKRAPIAQMYPLLVSSGCLSLTTLLATALRSQTQVALNQPNAVGSASTYMQEILQMLMKPLVPDHILALDDCYRFRIIQEQARLEYAREVMLLVRGSLAEYAASRNQQPPRPQPLDDEKVKSYLFELLRDLILIDPQAASETLSLKSPNAKLATLIEALTTRLLVPHCGSVQKTFEQVLELANEFTLPFCQVKLSLNLAIHDPSTPEGAEGLRAQFEQLSIAMDNAIEADNIMWTGMLSYLSSDITLHLKNRAEARFLDLFPSLKSLPFDENVSKGDVHMAENLLTVVDSVLRGASTSKPSSFSSGIADRLTDLWEILGSTSQESATLKSSVLTHWLPLLLSYLALQAYQSSTAVDLSKLPGSDVRARVLVILAGIVLELDKYPTSRLGPRVFDIALIIADNLPEESRLQCVRAVKDYTADPRVTYLFSLSPDPAENLMLAHREKGPPSHHERKMMAMNLGLGMPQEKLTPFAFRRWEILNEPTPNIGENDTSLSLTLFDARKI
ncbi:putative transcription mediator subunit Med12 [Rosellinia necatrix]|uniref:Mediator of RNA polymerase II transcription subunit 12 n=1 Tax=Rosellinia necatrix TaxID=77044 RepID=A0A1W2TGJ4_ROSNE|nr:putative transcription mediator subunit Med12 [Rosellinia necatrix]